MFDPINDTFGSNRNILSPLNLWTESESDFFGGIDPTWSQNCSKFGKKSEVFQIALIQEYNMPLYIETLKSILNDVKNDQRAKLHLAVLDSSKTCFKISSSSLS